MKIMPIDRYKNWPKSAKINKDFGSKRGRYDKVGVRSKPDTNCRSISALSIVAMTFSSILCNNGPVNLTQHRCPEGQKSRANWSELLISSSDNHLSRELNGSSSLSQEKLSLEGDANAGVQMDDMPTNSGETLQPSDGLRAGLQSDGQRLSPQAPENHWDDDYWDEEPFDDEQEFYSQNPLDHSVNGKQEEVDLGKDVNVTDVDFDDFYDKAYRRSFERANSTGSQNEPLASASRLRKNARQLGPIFGPIECAGVLARGTCITYPMVEWSIQMARRWLRYQRPGGLGSPEPRESAINSVAELVEFTTRILASQLQLSLEETSFELDQVDMSRTSLWRDCPALFRTPPNCQILARYRTLTGQCNNPVAPHLGSSNMPFVRILPPQYDDGIGLPRQLSTSGTLLPSARLVALSLHPGMENPSPQFSVLFMNWGQLINHDLALASGARDATGYWRPCCQASMMAPNNWPRNQICMPIGIGPDDPLYSMFGVRCHEFKRTLAGLRPGCTLGPRTQLNTVTSYMDASFVYGSTYSWMRSIRSARRGAMAMWNYFSRQGLKPLLPAQVMNPDEECVSRRGRLCFRSGDSRTNQQVNLVVLHTMHTRQHNRLAGALALLNPHWPDERIYHEARHIHIAMVQHILLSEWLPALLGAKLCAKYNLIESESGSYWDHYDPSINPGISQAFATAAFRFGHSSVPSHVFRFNHQHEPILVYQLRQLFRQPWPLYEPWAMDQFLLGLVDAPAQELDPFISSDLSGHLLQMPNQPIGLDLVAMNIQRARDQGVPGYNAFRDWCGLGKVSSFDQLDAHMSNLSSHTMALIYDTVDDIDLFSGGMSEFPVEGAQIGPTFACIIGRQFEKLRIGDRFWFENSVGPQAFTPAQLESIKHVSLARLICANSDSIFTIQQMALQLPHPILNPRIPCAALPDLDISLWFELRSPTPEW